MQLVLLSGRLGTRLWPLSDANHPKQFLKLFNKEQKSMLQITYNNISKLNLPIYVASQNIWTKNIFDQIGKNVKIISEPNSMDTFAAILNIAEYLYYKENISKFARFAVEDWKVDDKDLSQEETARKGIEELDKYPFYFRRELLEIVVLYFK